MVLTEDDMRIIQRWFSALETVAPEFLGRVDWELAQRLKGALALAESAPLRKSQAQH